VKGKQNYDLCWLNYRPINISDDLKVTLKHLVLINVDSKIIRDEYKKFCKSSFNINPQFSSSISNMDSCVILGLIKDLKNLFPHLNSVESSLKMGGFYITKISNHPMKILIVGSDNISLLYALFKFFEILRINSSLDLNIIENPKLDLRLLNHWDNLDGTIERGYSGKSVFFKDNKIIINERTYDYARLIASIGINGVVINNVNVKKNEIELITSKYLKRLSQLAEVFKDYGIKIYLSINFASPIYLGNLETADPLDKRVQNWWKEKVKEIYEFIPNFGGFLVKADSEFNPGPYVYGRTHADGANMLSEALSQYNGIVIWRAFVYNCMQDWRDYKTDRAKAAFENFMPLDGSFNDNVYLQIKFGPMDFQVREPVSPLFGALKKTNQILELQITQEYTGQQIHLCYLPTYWKEILNFDTYAEGKNSEVKKRIRGIAGVSNIGDDINWTGHDLAQANLYGFGRLSWNPDDDVEKITKDWIVLTFGKKEKVINNIFYMLIKSHKIYEKYTTPFGLGWMVNPGHHYGPNPEGYEYSHWGTYHRANYEAIGVDRTSKGTGFTLQYNSPWREIFDNIETCPEELLLFFHRVRYDYKLKSGKTLLQSIYDLHFEGVEEAELLREKWIELKDEIEDTIFQRVLNRLNMQIEHAKEWRDVINTYFYRKTGIPDEKGRKIYP